MTGADATRDLQAFVDERWAVAQPRFYPEATEAPRVPADVTPREAADFLAAVTSHGDEAPLLVVDDDRRERSDRYPPLSDGRPRGYLFFDERRRLAPESIVGWAAIARLRYGFGWPREHLVVESPTLLEDGHKVLGDGALDTLLLEEPCAELRAKMPLSAARSRVGVEAKETAKKLDKLLAGMRACHAGGAPHGKSNHVKCSAIDVLRPPLFLGVAAGETWRLFTVVEHRGRAVLGDELSNLDGLHFSATSER